MWSTNIIYCDEERPREEAGSLTLWNGMNGCVLSYFLWAAAWNLRMIPELFQSEDGSDDNDSQSLWRTSSSGLSPRGRTDWKVGRDLFWQLPIDNLCNRSILEYQNQAKRLFKTLSDNSPQRCSIETGNGQYIFQWVKIYSTMKVVHDGAWKA